MAGIVFYDLKSKNGQVWAPNPWKIRMALNYKGLDYTTKFLEVPEVKPTLKALGVPPHDSVPEYTVPSIKIGDGPVVTESRDVARALDKAFPEKPLRVDDPIADQAQELHGKLFTAFGPDILPDVVNILSEESAKYMEETRAVMFGMSINDLYKAKGGQPAWEAAAPLVTELVAMMKKTEGPFMLGKEASYADFLFGSFFYTLKVINPEKHKKLLAIDPALAAHWEACQPYYAGVH